MSLSVLRKNLNDVDSSFCEECKGAENRMMVSCDNCMFWFHYKCVDLDLVLVKRIESYFCKECRRVNRGMKIEWKNTGKTATRQVKEKFYFPVDFIVRHKIQNNKRFFLIHWESFGANCRTWEPEENMDGCLNILQNYLESKNLPYSRVAGLMGSVVDEINEFDVRNWITMDKTLEVFGKLFGEYFKGCNVHFQEYTGTFSKTGCYFLRYNHHCYAIFWDEDKQLATIGDGWNYYRKNFDVASYINDLLGVRVRSIIWLHVVAVDHCTSAAILIQLELFRDYVADRFRICVDSPKRWRNRLVLSLHRFPSVKLRFEIQKQWYHCSCGKRIKARMHYLRHRAMCQLALEIAYRQEQCNEQQASTSFDSQESL